MTLTLVIGNKNYSSWSLRAWLTLKQSGLLFKEVRIPLNTPEFAATIAQYSPSKRVPVLRHGEITIWESLAIGEYIAELAVDKHLWSADPTTRAVARSISCEMHAGFSHLREQMPMNCRASLPGLGRGSGVQSDIDRIGQIWRDCRQQFGSGGEFLFGNWSIADAMYAPVVMRFITYDVALDPISQAYVQATVQIPAIAEWLSAAAAETEVIASEEIGRTKP